MSLNFKSEMISIRCVVNCRNMHLVSYWIISEKTGKENHFEIQKRITRFIQEKYNYTG